MSTFPDAHLDVNGQMRNTENEMYTLPKGTEHSCYIFMREMI